MKFEEALPVMRAGKYGRRKSWLQGIYAFIFVLNNNDNHISLFQHKPGQPRISDIWRDDHWSLLRDDWEIANTDADLLPFVNP